VRIVNCIAWVAWAAVLLSAPGVSQSAEKQDAPKEMEMFATNRYFSKGGIGMINKHLYAVVKSASGDSNELIVKPVEDKEERWKGKIATETEAVFFYDGRVWSSRDIPDRFDLSKAVVVSFESKNIRFFDFQTMSGGYYERIRR